MIVYGLADRRLAETELGEVIEMYASREHAIHALAQVLADEPDLDAVLEIVEVDLSGRDARSSLT
jgi:hypothetical protein